MLVEVKEKSDCPFFAESRGYEVCSLKTAEGLCWGFGSDCPLVNEEEIVVKKKE